MIAITAQESDILASCLITNVICTLFRVNAGYTDNEIICSNIHCNAARIIERGCMVNGIVVDFDPTSKVYDWYMISQTIQGFTAMLILQECEINGAYINGHNADFTALRVLERISDTHRPTIINSMKIRNLSASGTTRDIIFTDASESAYETICTGCVFDDTHCPSGNVYRGDFRGCTLKNINYHYSYLLSDNYPRPVEITFTSEFVRTTSKLNTNASSVDANTTHIIFCCSYQESGTTTSLPSNSVRKIGEIPQSFDFARPLRKQYFMGTAFDMTLANSTSPAMFSLDTDGSIYLENIFRWASNRYTTLMGCGDVINRLEDEFSQE